MTNQMTPEQMLNSLKESQAALVDLAARSLECMEKHIDLNLKAAKANLADATQAAHQLLAVKDLPELSSTVQSVATPNVSKAAPYSRNVYNINAEAAIGRHAQRQQGRPLQPQCLQHQCRGCC